MPVYEQTPIRLQVTLVGNPPVPPIDFNTGQAPKFWRSSNVSIAVGIFDAAGNPVDLTNLVASGQLQLFLFNTNSDLVPLFAKSIAGGTLFPLITNAGWNNGTQQNATFLLSPAETDQALGGAASANFWFVLNGLSSSGSTILYAAGPCTIYNASSALPASAMPTPSYSAQANSAGNTTVTPASNLHTEKITIGGVARTSNIVISQAGLSAGAHVDVLIDASGAVPAIVLQFYLGSLGGSNPFAWSTSGGTTRALFRFVFDGANLQPIEQLNPAY